MSTFKITGSPLRHRIWKRILEIAQRKTHRYQDLTIDITTILVPTPSSMIIKYLVVNTGKKYELMLQGKYAEIYKSVQDGESVNPDKINAEIMIRTGMQNAYEIN